MAVFSGAPGRTSGHRDSLIVAAGAGRLHCNYQLHSRLPPPPYYWTWKGRLHSNIFCNSMD